MHTVEATYTLNNVFSVVTPWKPRQCALCYGSKFSTRFFVKAFFRNTPNGHSPSLSLPLSISLCGIKSVCGPGGSGFFSLLCLCFVVEVAYFLLSVKFEVFRKPGASITVFFYCNI